MSGVLLLLVSANELCRWYFRYYFGISLLSESFLAISSDSRDVRSSQELFLLNSSSDNLNGLIYGWKDWCFGVRACSLSDLFGSKYSSTLPPALILSSLFKPMILPREYVSLSFDLTTLSLQSQMKYCKQCSMLPSSLITSSITELELFVMFAVSN